MIGRVFVLLAVVCAVYGSVVTSPMSLKGVPIRPSAQREFQNPEPEPCDEPGKMSCIGCYTTTFCTGKKEKEVIQCTGSAPFCDYGSGSCGQIPNMNECGVEDTFTCMKEGYFPDPFDCAKFHVCDSKLSSKVLACGTNSIYVPGQMGCTDSDPKICTNPPIDCIHQLGRKIPFPANATYFAICIDSKSAIVDMCDVGEVLNAQSQNCEKPHC